MGIHLIAVFGLFISVIAVCVLAVQLFVMVKRRRESMEYELNWEKIVKSIRKGTTTSFAAQFIASGLLMAVFWMSHNVAYKIFIPLRHVFFIMWHLSVLRHWVYVFDPLSRRMNHEQMDFVWLAFRVLLVTGAVLLIVLLLSGTSVAKMSSWDLNEIVWSFSSIVVMASCIVFFIFLRRMHRACSVAVALCRKQVSDVEAMTIDIVLRKPVVDIKYLMEQSADTMYLGYLVHLNAVRRCIGYCAVSMMCGVLQELVWIVYFANGDNELDVFANLNGLRAVYYWLPELIPFCYWLWVRIP